MKKLNIFLLSALAISGLKTSAQTAQWQKVTVPTYADMASHLNSSL